MMGSIRIPRTGFVSISVLLAVTASACGGAASSGNLASDQTDVSVPPSGAPASKSRHITFLLQRERLSLGVRPVYPRVPIRRDVSTASLNSCPAACRAALRADQGQRNSARGIGH